MVGSAQYPACQHRGTPGHICKFLPSLTVKFHYLPVGLSEQPPPPMMFPHPLLPCMAPQSQFGPRVGWGEVMDSMRRQTSSCSA